MIRHIKPQWARDGEKPHATTGGNEGHVQRVFLRSIADAAAQPAHQPAFYRRRPAGGAGLRRCGGRRGGVRNYGTAERDHGADRQEADRDVDPRELFPLVVPEGPLEPVSAPRRGSTSSVFRRLAWRRSTEDVGQEVHRGETLG